MQHSTSDEGECILEKSERFVYAQETEAPISPAGFSRPRWKVLIVDDDEEVHAITTMVLRDFEFDGGKLEFLLAHSGKEGMRLIDENPDTAVMLLDVVMETDQAGLEVVKYVRDVRQNRFVRIILRTGQPGDAPEKSIVVNYDINDYKEKAELTSDKLTTAMISALRAYRDITVIENSRRGLEQIISSSRKLFESQSLSQFCTGVLHQLTTLMNLGNDALYAHSSGFAAKRHGGSDMSNFSILAGTGQFTNAVGLRIVDLGRSQLTEKIKDVVKNRKAIIEGGMFIAYFPTSSGSENIIYTQVGNHLTEVDKRLINVFATSVSVAFDNRYLNQELTQTQVELIYTLGGVIESRCNETAQHVRRVGEYSIHLATLLGLPRRDVELLRLGAPLHDLGKVGIPDAILQKKEKLTDEELAVMRRHTTIGYRLLKSSDLSTLRSAALIAQQHHEWWDGTGYPSGLVGEDIHIFSRIVALADVFDGLTTKRAYKEAWTVEHAFEYIRDKRGVQFDPHLVDLFLKQKKDFEIIMHSSSDLI